MRDYTNVDRYLNELLEDVYEQPEDPKHKEWARWTIDNWCSQLVGCHTVLDVGCGQGFAKDLFAQFGIAYVGVTLGKDYLVCKEKGLDVYNEDFTFLHFQDKSFPLIFARHSLEHSVMPLVSLMEWNRVSSQWLCVVLPNPSYWKVNGRNHYSVLYLDQIKWLFALSGWHILWENISNEEYRFMCEKSKPVRE